MTTVPRCLCVPTTPLDLIHRMLLKMLCRTSNARWRMAALVPNGTHGLSFSEAPTKVPGTAYRLITSRCSSGTSTILYAVDGSVVQVSARGAPTSLLSSHTFELRILQRGALASWGRAGWERSGAPGRAFPKPRPAQPGTAYKIVDVPELQRDVIKRYAVPGTFVGASEKESP